MPRIDLLQTRSGTASEWASVNPVLAVNEQGDETDTLKTKRGDGVTAWNDLPYFNEGGSAQDLQSVTEEGATTDMAVTFENFVTLGNGSFGYILFNDGTTNQSNIASLPLEMSLYHEAKIALNAPSIVKSNGSEVLDETYIIDEDDMASDSDTKVPTQQSVKAYVDANSGGGGVATVNKFITIALSDLATDLTTGTNKGYYRMPYGATLVNAEISLLDAGTTTGLTVDINKNGFSILSTLLTTDPTEETSATATTPFVISDDFLPYDASLTFDFDTVPTNGLGAMITLEVKPNIIEEKEYVVIPLSDLATDLTTGTNKGYYRMPYGATLEDAVITLMEAGTITGIEVDILKNGVSVLSTKLTTDPTEDTSVTASVPLVISDDNLTDNAKITFDFDEVPTSAKGAIITLILTKD